MMKSGEEQKNLDNMSIQDLVNAKTNEALKKDKQEAEKFNKEAKEQSLKMTKGFEELINDTAKLTSANGSDSEYAPEAGQITDSTYEFAEKRANEESEYDRILNKADDKMKKDASKSVTDDTSETSSDPFHFMPDVLGDEFVGLNQQLKQTQILKNAEIIKSLV